MATEVKVGGYKELNYLKDARSYTSVATGKTESLMREVARIQEGVGRPDFGYFKSTIAEVLVYLAKTSRAQDEIWNMRRELGQTVASDVDARMDAIEQQLAHLYAAMGVKQ